MTVDPVTPGFVEELKAAGDIAKLKNELKAKCTVKRTSGGAVINEVSPPLPTLPQHTLRIHIPRNTKLPACP